MSAWGGREASGCSMHPFFLSLMHTAHMTATSHEQEAATVGRCVCSLLNPAHSRLDPSIGQSIDR